MFVLYFYLYWEQCDVWVTQEALSLKAVGQKVDSPIYSKSDYKLNLTRIILFAVFRLARIILFAVFQLTRIILVAVFRLAKIILFAVFR